MSTLGLEGAIAELRGVVAMAPDPEATVRRLLRFLARERQFNTSPAAVPIDELAAARARGIPSHRAADVRR